jgi:hypothetical protein
MRRRVGSKKGRCCDVNNQHQHSCGIFPTVSRDGRPVLTLRPSQSFQFHTYPNLQHSAQSKGQPAPSTFSTDVFVAEAFEATEPYIYPHKTKERVRLDVPLPLKAEIPPLTEVFLKGIKESTPSHLDSSTIITRHHPPMARPAAQRLPPSGDK